jgi:hypothetical protein
MAIRWRSRVFLTNRQRIASQIEREPEFVSGDLIVRDEGGGRGGREDREGRGWGVEQLSPPRAVVGVFLRATSVS